MFKEHILKIEKEVSEFKEVTFKDWGYNHFSGFYSELKKCLNIKKYFGYEYISNPNGGFIGCWWHPLNIVTLKQIGITSSSIKDIYLQIEKNSKKEFQLAIKMNYVPSEIQLNIKNFENDILLIDKHFNKYMQFNKKNRVNLYSKNKKYKDNKNRCVTLFKCPLNLNNFELTVQNCKDAEILLNSLKINNAQTFSQTSPI